MNNIKDEIKKEFIDSYKNSTDEPEKKIHFLKLFDKTGEDIISFKEDEEDKFFNELKLRIRCFFQEALKLNTVSFLFGTGASIPLGAEKIFNMPESICKKIHDIKLNETCKKLVSCYGGNNCNEKAGCNVNLERFLGDLIRFENIISNFGGIFLSKEMDEETFGIKAEKNLYKEINTLIKEIKKELTGFCNLPKIEKIKDELYKDDPLKMHKEFIKKVLARPVNLKRVSIFTTNYDTIFEQAMDNLGVLYIDGFVGNIRRTFKPEVYNYDYYFPASTTEGDVHRLDKVIHLYKLHGSLNWIECTPDPKNIFGIEQQNDTSKSHNKTILIYPQPMKEEETLGFPYSEMFRRFANIIQQPQNCLIVYGYGFGDEHINRVIFNALSIPTFQLIVISHNWTDNLKEFYEKVKNDSRVSFLIGSYLGDWYRFVFELLPDIKQLELDEKILDTMKKLKE